MSRTFKPLPDLRALLVRANSVHLYTRSKVDQERFFRWEWRVRPDPGQITFEVQEFDLMNQAPAGLVRECAGLLSDSGVRTLRQLGEEWDLPKPVTVWVCEAMQSAGMLEKTARGFRRVR